MFPCFHRGCPGHDRELAAIYHTLEHLVTTVDQLTQDFATFQTDVQTGVDELKAQIAASNPGGIPADVQAQIDALDATINGADVAVKADGSGDHPGGGRAQRRPADRLTTLNAGTRPGGPTRPPTIPPPPPPPPPPPSK